jgi:Cu+-exporting ATPase
MAKDPVCGMFVEEKPDAIRYAKDGREYYFCSKQCLDEFTQPEKELRKLKTYVVISIALTIPIIIFSLPHMFPVQFGNLFSMNLMHYSNYIMLALATPLQFWIGWRFYRGLWDGIKAKASNMDTLIAIGTTAAYLYSAIVTIAPGHFPFKSVYFETAAIIITLILIGRLPETRTKEKASNAVRKLLDLQPRMAKIIGEGGVEVEVPIEQVKEGEVMVIRPGERIPTDGLIVEGSSSIDESAITGESIPVDKKKKDQVIGATINKGGLLKVKATKIGQDTVLSQIITLVEEARTGKAQMQRLVDQVAKYFVPGVLAIAIGVGFGWYFIGDIGITFSLLAFVSVIIIACPCALGIATPAALMMGSGKGAENGILFKGGEYLEIAKKVNTIVFDKTGTLTKGKPSVTDIVDLSDGILSETELLRLTAIAESGSEHPLGQAVVNYAKEKGIIVSNPDSFEAVSGHGLRAIYADHAILIGNRKLMEDNAVSVTETVDAALKQLETQGKTATLVAIDNKLAGIIALEDTIKENARETIDSLTKSMGIEVVILSGDNERTARAVASKLGIKRVIAQVLPQQKEQIISKIRDQEKKVVAMVGDGINDAPALAKADLGIAIGSGTDIAKETGGIILIKDDLRYVVTALDLGRKTVSKIIQNLFWAFAYNAGLIPIAGGILVPFMGVGIFGWLPMLAGLAMAMSSVTVVGNSILLGRYKPRSANKKSKREEVLDLERIRARTTTIQRR